MTEYGNQEPPSLRLPMAQPPQVKRAKQESSSPAENDMGEHLDRASQAASQGGETRRERAEPLQHKENTTGLPDTLKARIERLSGISLDDVQVHYHSSHPAQVQALAYTQGTEIHVGPGQEQHLAHEAWHVIQQKQGRVQPTLQAKGMAINDDQGLEREADAMGTQATKRSAEGLLDRFAAPVTIPLPVPMGTKLPSHVQSGRSARPKTNLRNFMKRAAFLQKRGSMLICSPLSKERRRKNRNIA